jgi:raffinose/stachyose/melibiose transport system permease protein
MAIEHATNTVMPSTGRPSQKHGRMKSTQRRSVERKRKLIAWAFMVPFFLVNFSVILGPSLSAIYYSFTDWSGIGPAHFVGLANFQHLLTDGEFHQAILFNIFWTAMFLTVPIAMGLLGAFLLSHITRFQMFFRAAYFIPYVTASVVNAAIWQQLLSPQQGISSLFDRIGLHFLDNVYFFGDVHLALPSVAFVDNWHFWGFLVVLFLAAMQSVDQQLYEAAKVDGASNWRQFYHVTLPGIRPVLGIVVLLVTVWSLLTFEYPYVITQGGPAGATQVITLLLYKNAFSLNEAGYAASMGLTLSAVAAAITLIYLYLQRRGVEV